MPLQRKFRYPPLKLLIIFKQAVVNQRIKALLRIIIRE
jgi:hypothetical protein